MNDLERGIHAEKLLSDETLALAFEQMRQALLKQIEESPIEDHSGVEKLRISLKLLRGVRANLEHAVRDGKVAAYRLEEERRRKNPLQWAREQVKRHAS